MRSFLNDNFPCAVAVGQNIDDFDRISAGGVFTLTNDAVIRAVLIDHIVAALFVFGILIISVERIVDTTDSADFRQFSVCTDD